MTLGVLVFVPLKYVYPSRTTILPRLTMLLGLLWAIVNLTILVQYPDYAPGLLWLSLAYVVYYCALTIYVMGQDRTA
jgi:phosphatidylcholine synthase